MKKRAVGFSLMEFAFITAIIAVVMIAVVIRRKDAASTVDVGTFTAEMTDYADRLRAQCTTPDYGCLTVATAIALRPTAWTPNADNLTVRNRYGGSMSYAWATVDGVPNAALDLTVTNIGADVCGPIAVQTFARFARITVNTTPLKTATTTSLDLATANAACNQAANTIVWRLL